MYKRQEQRHIGVDTIRGNHPKGLHFCSIKWDMLLFKLLLCRFKAEVLFQRTHGFEAVPIRFLDHSSDRSICSRVRGCAVSDIDPAGFQPLAAQIIGPVGPFLNGHSDDILAMYMLGLIAHKHGHIGLDGISNHIVQLQHDLIGVFDPHNTSIVADANIQRSAFCVGKCNDFFANIAHDLRFQFNNFAFNQCHTQRLLFLVVIIIILVILVNLYSSDRK